jgi:deoxyribodipyrimidine photo-lyase
VNFITESVFDTQQALQKIGSDLILRIGSLSDVLHHTLQWFRQNHHADGTSQGEVVGVCMTKEVGVEENQQEDEVKDVADQHGIPVHWWRDEKYLIET